MGASISVIQICKETVANPDHERQIFSILPSQERFTGINDLLYFLYNSPQFLGVTDWLSLCTQESHESERDIEEQYGIRNVCF